MVDALLTKVLSSTGEMTNEVWIKSGDTFFSESGPSGCTKGGYEAPEYSKHDTHFLSALQEIPDGTSQRDFDRIVGRFGTKLSAPASIAYFKSRLQPRLTGSRIPKIICNVINGGKHTGGSVEMCEFMIIPDGKDIAEDIDISSSVFLEIGTILKAKGQDNLVSGREGGYVPKGLTNEQIIEIIDAAISRLNVPCSIAIDIAANNFCSRKGGKFIYSLHSVDFTSTQLARYYINLLDRFLRIRYLEDPFHEDDIKSWRKFLTYIKSHNSAVLVVGDDLTVTQTERMKLCEGAFNAVILKINQTGTVTGFLDAFRLASIQGCKTIVSQRSGETDSHIISDLAMLYHADYLKAGAPARERIVKYNRLLRVHLSQTEKKLKVLA